MPNEDRDDLRRLLATFNATWLGEGDTDAGTNLLVAKAVTLANLSRTGCGIQPSNLSRMKAGCSLLVSGSLSPGLVMDGIVTEVGIRQNILTAHLRRLIGDKIADAGKKGQRTVAFPSEPKANYAESALYQLEQRDPDVPMDNLEKWREVLSLPPNPRIDDLAARPKVLVTAKGPKDLDRQLCGLHGNRPLVVLGLNRPPDAGAYAGTCDALLNGLYPLGEGGETAMGNLLVTDPGGVLERVAPQGDDNTAWLRKMVWLVDGADESDAAEDVPAPGMINVSDTAARFGEALTAVLAKRLDNQDAGTVVHEFDLGEAQVRWVAYLKEMEDRIPGITGIARGLPATLAFGLTELADAPNCERLTVTPGGVEALCRWVIGRMANARSEMLNSADLEGRMEIARRIFFRVAHEPLTDRDIYRAFSLQADFCRELLSMMEADGLLRRVGQKWERVEGAAFSDSFRNRLALAV